MQNVFVSVGRAFRPEQEAFVSAVEGRLRDAGFKPRTLGRSAWTSEAPLVGISQLMDSCHATVIIAFERVRLDAGTDLDEVVGERVLTTVWNQIEATLAYDRGHPLLVMVDEDVWLEGLLEKGHDWFVQQVRLEVSLLSTAEFRGVFDHWADSVRRRSARPFVHASEEQTASPHGEGQKRKDGASDDRIRILMLASSPADEARLRLDQEHRDIDRALRRADFRDRFDFHTVQAVRTTDVTEAMLRFRPNVVHFSGHGSSDGELIFEDALGNGVAVPPDGLRRLFSKFSDDVECVLLNACYSKRQAEAIALTVASVIGMPAPIADADALLFSAAFYQALGYGRSFDDAYELGVVELALQDSATRVGPVLLKASTA